MVCTTLDLITFGKKINKIVAIFYPLSFIYDNSIMFLVMFAQKIVKLQEGVLGGKTIKLLNFLDHHTDRPISNPAITHQIMSDIF